MNKIKADDGYFFGIGVFETIAIEQGRLIFLEEHMKRLRKGMEALHIPHPRGREKLSTEHLLETVRRGGMEKGALKIGVSQENVTLSFRENPYTKEQSEKGFLLDLASTVRNETSPFTYLKSLNCGENILEKRAARRRGMDEPVFINTKGQLAEGATTNLFFGKNGRLYTPPLSCGLLDGIVRKFVMQKFPVEEKAVYPCEAGEYDEMMVTNSLLGIMPVNRFEDIAFSSRTLCSMLTEEYEKCSQNSRFLL